MPRKYAPMTEVHRNMLIFLVNHPRQKLEAYDHHLTPLLERELVTTRPSGKTDHSWLYLNRKTLTNRSANYWLRREHYGLA